MCKGVGDMGIDVQTEQPVREIEVDADGVVAAVLTDAGRYPADLVVLGLGMGPGAGQRRRPAPGRDRGDRGRPHAAQPLAPRGVRRRRLLADVLPDHRRGTVRRARHARQQAGPGGRGGDRWPGGPLRRGPGDGAHEVGDLEIGRTGLCTTQAEQAGYEYRSEIIEGTTRAGYYPGAEEITVKLLSDRGSGLLLGAQVVGGPGSGKRIDVLATAIWAGMTAEEFAGSDLSYAPPFSPTYDPVIVAARVASRVEQG